MPGGTTAYCSAPSDAGREEVVAHLAAHGDQAGAAAGQSPLDLDDAAGHGRGEVAVEQVPVERVHDGGDARSRRAATRPRTPAFAVCVCTTCGRKRRTSADQLAQRADVVERVAGSGPSPRTGVSGRPGARSAT